MKRKPGNSRLVYDKKRRTIITIWTPWWKRAWHPYAIGMLAVAIIVLILMLL